MGCRLTPRPQRYSAGPDEAMPAEESEGQSLVTIAVTTPTGNVGRHVVAGLVRAGIRPRVLLRDARRLAPGLAGWVDSVEVDLADPGQVTEVTRGVAALYWVTPPTAGPEPLEDCARFAAVAERAVRDNRIPRVVFQSSVGAELRSGAGEIDGLGLTEDAFDRTGADVVHLRCGYFFSNLLLQVHAIIDGTFRVVLPVEHRMPWVAPRDVAQVAVSRLLSPWWSGQVVQGVHGPEDLSWLQVARVVQQVLGSVVEVEQVPDDAMRRVLLADGLSASRVEAVMGTSTGLRFGFVPAQPRTAETTTPTRLSTWCRDDLAPNLPDLARRTVH